MKGTCGCTLYNVLIEYVGFIDGKPHTEQITVHSDSVPNLWDVIGLVREYVPTATAVTFV